MDKLERAYCLHKIFQQSHYPVSLMYLCDELQCKEATVKRLIYDMRLYLDAPIINKPGHGYYYAKNTAFELPGIWFSADELHALLTIEQLTSRISGGFLGSSFALLHGKIESILNKADDLRTFALEKISRVVSDDGVCRELDATLLDKKLALSFGIFSGEPTATAVLRFTPEAAVWVADEAWFPDCTSQWLEDGRYELHIPYNNPTELILEICRHGPDVEVMEPPELRDQVAKRLATAASQYAPEITI